MNPPAPRGTTVPKTTVPTARGSAPPELSAEPLVAVLHASAPPESGAEASDQGLLGVAVLHRQCALDAGEVLGDEATQRRRGVGVRFEPCARRVAQSHVREGRRV